MEHTKFQQIDDAGAKNRYRFLTFAQQLKRLDSVTARLRSIHQDDVNQVVEDTFFDDALNNWLELNRSAEFDRFREEIYGLTGSTALILLNKKKIIDALLKHALVPNTLALEPLLDLVVQMARELRDEYIEYFYPTFDVLVTLITPKSHTQEMRVSVVNHVFACLLFLLKHLRKLIRYDEFFKLKYHVLLGNGMRDYVRTFAAESYAYLLRSSRVEMTKKHIEKTIVPAIMSSADATFCKSLGEVAAFMMVSAQHRLHSSHKAFLEAWLILTKKQTKQADYSTPFEALGWSTLEAMLTNLAEKVRDNTAAPVVDMLLAHLKEAVDSVLEAPKSGTKCYACARLLRLSQIFTTYRRGARVNHSQVIAFLKQAKRILTSNVGVAGVVITEALDHIAEIGRKHTPDVMNLNLLDTVFALPLKRRQFVAFCEKAWLASDMRAFLVTPMVQFTASQISVLKAQNMNTEADAANKTPTDAATTALISTYTSKAVKTLLGLLAELFTDDFSRQLGSEVFLGQLLECIGVQAAIIKGIHDDPAYSTPAAPGNEREKLEAALRAASGMLYTSTTLLRTCTHLLSQIANDKCGQTTAATGAQELLMNPSATILSHLSQLMRMLPGEDESVGPLNKESSSARAERLLTPYTLLHASAGNLFGCCVAACTSQPSARTSTSLDANEPSRKAGKGKKQRAKRSEIVEPRVAIESGEMNETYLQLLTRHGRCPAVLEGCLAYARAISSTRATASLLPFSALVALKETWVALLATTFGTQQRRILVELMACYETDAWLSIDTASDVIVAEEHSFSKSKAAGKHNATKSKKNSNSKKKKKKDQTEATTDAQSALDHRGEPEDEHSAAVLHLSKEQLDGDVDVLRLLVRLEQVPMTLESYRDKRIPLLKLLKGRYLTRMNSVYLEIVCAYLLGLYHVNFAPIWKEVDPVLERVATVRPAVLWPCFEPILAKLLSSSQDISKAILSHLRTLAGNHAQKEQMAQMAQMSAINEVPCASSLSVSDQSSALIDAASYDVLVPHAEKLISVRHGGSPSSDNDDAVPATLDRFLANAEETLSLQTRVDVLKLVELYGNLAMTWHTLTEKKHALLVTLFLQFNERMELQQEQTARVQDLTAANDSFGGVNVAALTNIAGEGPGNEDQTETVSGETKGKESGGSDGSDNEDGEDEANAQQSLVPSVLQARKENVEVDEDANKEEQDGSVSSSQSRTSVTAHLSALKRLSNNQLLFYLRIFATFHNGHALAHAHELHALFLTFLQHPRDTIKQAAMQCAFLFNKKAWQAHSDDLLEIAGENGPALNRHLISFSIKDDVKPEHRDEILDILYRVLLAKMLARKGKTTKYSPATLRSTVLRYLMTADMSTPAAKKLTDQAQTGTPSLSKRAKKRRQKEGKKGKHAAVADVPAPQGPVDGDVTGSSDVAAPQHSDSMCHVTAFFQLLLAPFLHPASHHRDHKDHHQKENDGSSAPVQLIEAVANEEDFEALLGRLPISTNAHQSIPLAKQQGFLVLFEHVCKVLGMKAIPYLPTFIAITLKIAANMESFLLEARQAIAPRHIGQLKAIRNLCYRRIAQVYAKYDTDALGCMNSAIHATMLTNNVLERMYHESSTSIGPILSLFLTWSARPEYHALFALHGDRILTKLFAIFEHKAMSADVERTILTIADNLLTEPEHFDHLYKKYKTKGEEEYNPAYIRSSVMAPHVHQLVLSLSRRMIHQTQTDQKPQALKDLNLSVLSRVAHFAEDEDETRLLCGLLVPYLTLPPLKLSEGRKVLLLRFLARSITRFGKGLQYFDVVVSMFGRVYQRETVEAICQTVRAMAREEADLAAIMDSVDALAAFSSKMSDDSPDFDRRIGALNALLDKKFANLAPICGQIYAEVVGRMLFEEDYSLRSLSSEVFEALVDASLDNPSHFKHVLDRVLVIVKRAIRGKREPVRNGAIQIVAHIVRKDASKSDALGDLRSLSTVDFDFFENIVDYQRHKRLAAVRRLSFICDASRQLTEQAAAATTEHGMNADVEEAKEKDTAVDSDDDKSSNDAEDEKARSDDDSDSDSDSESNSGSDSEDSDSGGEDEGEDLLPIETAAAASALRTPLSSESITGYLLPIVTHFVFQSEGDENNNLVTASIECIGKLTGLLGWSGYSKWLWHYLSLVKKRHWMKNTIIRTVVAILDNFSFDVSSVSSSSAVPRDSASISHAQSTSPSNDHNGDDADIIDDGGDEGEGSGSDLIPSALAEVGENDIRAHLNGDNTAFSGNKAHEAAPVAFVAAAVAQTDPTMIYKDLVRDFFPKIEQLQTYKDEDNNILSRPAVSLAFVKLLMLFEEAILHKHLPKTLTKIAVVLKNRHQSVRMEARNALVKIAETLGPRYLSFIVQEAKASLTRGYQLHVLGYTMHAVLDALKSAMTPGDVDDVLEDLAQIFMDDLFGDVGGEKDNDDVKGKVKEAKACKAQDAFVLLAQFLTPSKCATLLSPLQDALAVSEKHKTIHKIEEALQHISRGLQNNAAADPISQLSFAYSCVAENINLTKKGSLLKEQTSVRKASILLLQPLKQSKGNADMHTYNTNAHLLVEFGLTILHNLYKSHAIELTNPTHLGYLDSFVSSLVDCLFSKYTRTLALAARCFALTVPAQAELPSLQGEVVPKIFRRLVKLYSRCGNTSASEDSLQLFQALCRATTSMILSVSSMKLESFKPQVEVLLSSIHAELDEAQKQSLLLALFRAILVKNMKLPVVYDIVDRVSEIMVQSHSQASRTHARAAFIAYITRYEMGRKRITKHMAFLAANLSYTYLAGRESVLLVLVELIPKLPARILREHWQVLYTQCILHLGNTESASNKKMLSAVVKQLFRHVDVSTRQEMLSMANKWFQESGKSTVERVALHVLMLFIEVDASFCKTLFPSVTKALVAIVLDLADEEEIFELPANDDKADGDSNNASEGSGLSTHVAKDSDDWDLLFQALTCLHKIVGEDEGVIRKHLLTEGRAKDATASKTENDDEGDDDDETEGEGEGEGDEGGFKTALVQCCVYSHAWVRQAATALLIDVLASASGKRQWLASQVDRMTFAETILTQAESQHISEEMATLLVRVSTLVGTALAEHDQETNAWTIVEGQDEEEDDDSDDDRDGKDDDRDGAELARKKAKRDKPQKRRGKSASAATTQAASYALDDADAGRGRRRVTHPLHVFKRKSSFRWFIHALTKKAEKEAIDSEGVADVTQHAVTVRDIVFKIYAVFLSSFERPAAQALLNTAMWAVFRTREKTRLPEHLTALLKQVVAFFREKAGKETYRMVAARVRRTLDERRRKRQIKEQQQMTANPRKALRRKAHRNDLKREARKRKVQRFKQIKFGGKSFNPTKKAKRQ